MSNSRALAMAICSVVFIIAATLGLFVTYVSTSDSTSTNPVLGKIAQVQCRLNVVPAKDVIKEQETCVEEKKADMREIGKNYPKNATLADFEWDDGCILQCIYGKLGMLTDDPAVPITKATKGMLGAKGISAEKLVGDMLHSWNTCIELAVSTAKNKGFDVCKTVSYHSFCAGIKIAEIFEKQMVVDC